MNPGTKRQTAQSPAELLERVKDFLAGCRTPIAVEPGLQPVRIERGRYALEGHRSGCVLHVWGEGGNIVRRIMSIRSQRSDSLDVRVRRFGASDTTLSLIDRARKGEGFERQAESIEFRESFRRLLQREFREWEIARLSCAADLERSLSAVYSRAVLRRGQQAWAVIGCAGDRNTCDQILTSGLIWLDLERSRGHKHIYRGLKVFLPYSRLKTSANRMAFLNRAALQFDLYGFDEQGGPCRVDADDYGNLSTDLRPCVEIPPPVGPVAEWLRRITADPNVESIPRPDGLRSLRVRGVGFALAGKTVMTYGLETQTPLTEQRLPEALALAREPARFRSPDAADPQNPLYRKYPESWLESQVRRGIAKIDSRIHKAPIYSHVPAVAGVERGVIDLVACDSAGRLAVLELKAGEDMHLPLQGLDYWMRVKWHLDRNEIASRGYFPGMELSALPPRLLLVSPAFDFHPTTETILKYFSPEIPVERVGVGADWRRDLRVAYRKTGAGRLA